MSEMALMNISSDENELEGSGATIAWRSPLLGLVLVSVCLITTAGNCLVVLAVCTKKYLRNPTGYLIISLAIADLIVGIVVMPLNSLYEMTHHTWILGLTMCDIFHAMDILASTSSIWNLCIISLDRYLAGQDPIGYRDRVSKRKIMIAIVFVWLMAVFLSFPAIVYWRRASPHLYLDQTKCQFTDSGLYVWFSSLVSFYIPLGLILFSYGKVFLIATRHSQSYKSGIKKVKTGRASTRKKESESALSEDAQPALRIHFGKGPKKVTSRSMRHGKSGQATTKLLLKQVSCRSLADGGSPLSGGSPAPGSSACSPLLRPPASSSSINTFGLTRRRIGSARVPVARTQSALSAPPPKIRVREAEDDSVSASPSAHSVVVSASAGAAAPPDGGCSPVVSTTRQPSQKRRARPRMGMREKSRKMMKYVHEQRAARTLSIVVGAFILCWLPFFFFSPLNVLCKNCFTNADQLFGLFTWMGYLNSMLNPLIYSRFSRDFRRAFKQLLTCQRERKVRTAIKTPLSLVFDQLISITQFWEQQQTAEAEAEDELE